MYKVIIYADVSHLQLPSKMKMTVCPKGAKLTTIGLPKKKRRSIANQ